MLKDHGLETEKSELREDEPEAPTLDDDWAADLLRWILRACFFGGLEGSIGLRKMWPGTVCQPWPADARRATEPNKVLAGNVNSIRDAKADIFCQSCWSNHEAMNAIEIGNCLMRGEKIIELDLDITDVTDCGSSAWMPFFRTIEKSHPSKSASTWLLMGEAVAGCRGECAVLITSGCALTGASTWISGRPSRPMAVIGLLCLVMV